LAAAMESSSALIITPIWVAARISACLRGHALFPCFYKQFLQNVNAH
jgi:hypothetical protein